MAATSPRLAPAQRAALKQWLDDARIELRRILDGWSSDDNAKRRTVAWIEEYLAADEERQRVMGDESREGLRRKLEDEADDGILGLGSLRESLSALHWILQQVDGLAVEAAAIGQALSQWNSQTQLLPTPALRAAVEAAFNVVEALLIECDGESDPAPIIEGYDALFERIVGFAHGKEQLFRDAILRVTQRISIANASTARSDKPPSCQPDKSPFSDAHFDDDEATFWLAAFHDSHLQANEKLSPWPIELDQLAFEGGKIVYKAAAPEAGVYAFAVTMTANWLTTADIPRFKRLLAQCEAKLAGSIVVEPVAIAQSQPAVGENRTDEGELADEFVFAPDGDGYYIAGFGERGHLSAKACKGLNQLYRLVQSPGEPVPMLELLGCADEPRFALDQHTKQPAIDGAELQRLRQRLADARCDLESAKADGNTVEEEHCLEEIEAVEPALQKLVGMGGKPRDLNNPLGKWRATIWGSIKRAVAKMHGLNSPMKELANHFDAAISSETGSFIYRQANAEKWRTSPLTPK
jgi:hypothetical protein